MAILGISSATKSISVGLCDNSKILAEITVSGKQAFTEELISYIDKIVKQSGAKLSAIAVVSGPGSYNGLRGGMASAKTLAHALSIPIVEVSTLEAIAFNLVDIEATIAAISDARRDEFNIAFFTASYGNIRRLTNDSVMHEDKIVDLLSKVEGELYLCGVTEEIYAGIKAENPETKIKAASDQLSIPRGVNAAQIGEKLLARGKTEDIMKLTPKYSVEPHIREFRA